MTTSQRITYSLFGQAVLLLGLYAAVALRRTVLLLAVNPAAALITPELLGAVGQIALNLAITSGLLGGGIYLAVSNTATNRLKNEGALEAAFALWTVIILGVLAGGWFIAPEYQALLNIPQAMGIALFVALLPGNGRGSGPMLTVWMTGMVVRVVLAVLTVIPIADPVLSDALARVAVHLRVQVADILALVGLGFWLLSRISNVPITWIRTGTLSVAGLLGIAGILVSLSPLYRLGILEIAAYAGVIVVPVAVVILGGHMYRGLAERNSARTLAGHWLALSTVLILFGMGALGIILAMPRAAQWTYATYIGEAQRWLAQMAVMAIVLGIINQVSAELRGQNRRVTGLLPFWLIGSGVIGSAIVLVILGVVQVYLERVLFMDAQHVQQLLVPLVFVWAMGAMLFASGVLIYLLGFWARRPGESTT